MCGLFSSNIWLWHNGMLLFLFTDCHKALYLHIYVWYLLFRTLTLNLAISLQTFHKDNPDVMIIKSELLVTLKVKNNFKVDIDFKSFLIDLSIHYLLKIEMIQPTYSNNPNTFVGLVGKVRKKLSPEGGRKGGWRKKSVQRARRG